MADMEHQIQPFKSKAYYKASTDQRSINAFQEKFDTLEEVMEAEREYGRKKMYYLEDYLADTRKKSAEPVS